MPAEDQKPDQFHQQTQGQGQAQTQETGLKPLAEDTGTAAITGLDPSDKDDGAGGMTGEEDNFAPEGTDNDVEVIESDPSIEAIVPKPSERDQQADGDGEFDGQVPTDPGGDSL